MTRAVTATAHDSGELHLAHPGLVIFTIMMVAVLEVLDATIVNVALPSMMPALSANTSEITWVLTAYVVASAIMLPLTGFISNRIGRKNMMIACVTGFMVASLASGMAMSLNQMVVFRVFQGAFGAALIPLSQAILRETFPLHKQGKAMAIWGMGIMMAPVLGPTLGGYITQDLNWRWVFYINIPICALGIALIYWVIPQTKIIKQRIDMIGLALMIIAVACLQIFLDQGNEYGWFSSNEILLLALISGFSFAGFLFRTFYRKHPVVKLSLYKDRNFVLACIIMLAFAGCLFGLMTVQPIMLEQVFKYPIITTGWTLAPVGLASAFGMVSASLLMNRINVKYLLVPGLALCSLSAWWFCHFSLYTSINYFIVANAITGLGMGLVMVPLSTYALATTSKTDMTEASGLFAYSRMLGTSVGISLISTLLSRESQINWSNMGASLNRFSHNVTHWLGAQHLSVNSPLAAHKLGAMLKTHATLQAFLDGYFAIAIAFALLIPLVLLLKHVDMQGDIPSAH
ncbi:MAG: DHA2 family efflux MFS transporter permease subunit [Coxiellaceae bacterium]|nr:DHA2 family efflux MFS transporter permease subunit [Coxiellaceae bacterium]